MTADTPPNLCGDVTPALFGRSLICCRPSGHDGAHNDRDGAQWTELPAAVEVAAASVPARTNAQATPVAAIRAELDGYQLAAAHMDRAFASPSPTAYGEAMILHNQAAVRLAMKLVELASAPSDQTPPELCGHCGQHATGYATHNNVRLCHPDQGMDCYRLVTVYRHPVPCWGCRHANPAGTDVQATPRDDQATRPCRADDVEIDPAEPDESRHPYRAYCWNCMNASFGDETHCQIWRGHHIADAARPAGDDQAETDRG